MTGSDRREPFGNVRLREMTASPDVSLSSRERPHGRAPDFYIVGQYKCGTTALYEMLKRHPEIFMPAYKEVWFHSPELRTRALGNASNWRPETIEDYLSLFSTAGPEQRIGEVTPSYLISHGAARSIADLQPRARIIAILREPASFLHSFHLQCLQNHTETENDLRKALALEPARREGRLIPRHAARPLELMYSEHVRYVEQLRRYEAEFSREQILVLIYEEFRRDNDAVVRELLRFLEVDDTAPIRKAEVNPTVQIRYPRLYALLRTLNKGQGPAARTTKAVLKTLLPKRYDALAIQRRLQWGRPDPPDQELMLELRHRFKGEVVALSEYLDRDLVSQWGYDEIG